MTAARSSRFGAINRLCRPVGCGVAAAFLLTMLPIAGARAETPEVLVELDRTQVYVGEAVNYRVLLNHCGMQAEPDMSAFRDFDVKLVSRTQIQSTRIVNNGGTREQQVRLGPLYEYQLTPHKTGRLQVPGPSVEVDGQTYVGANLRLDVADVDDQDLVYLTVTTEPESVYPLQPIRIELTIAVKGLPDPATDQDPLKLRRTMPTLTIPWADDERLGDALVPKVPVSRWASEYLGEPPYGIAVNDYQEAGAGVFGGFFGSPRRDARLAFHPTPRRVLREDGRGRRVEYWEYDFVRTVIPQDAGTFSLGTASIKGQFAARINTRGNVELDPVYAIAPPLDVIVKQPPLTGRPATYTGAIGSFVGGADLTPHQASVGDPMTLTVWVRGEGMLDAATAPDLAANETIAEQFKVYEATEKTEDGSRQFTFSLRPKTTAAQQFPAIPILTYFDVEQEQYVTLESDPIPITIAETDRLAASQIAMSPGAAGNGGEIGTLSAGIYANVTDLSQLRSDGVNLGLWFVRMGGLACLFVVIAIATQRWQRAREDTGLQRRKGAVGRARRRLEAAAGGSSDTVADAASGALIGLAADLCDLAEDGLTSADAAAGFASQGVSPALVDRLQDVLETCDAMRYASVGGGSGDLHAEAAALLTDLAQELRSRKLTA